MDETGSRIGMGKVQLVVGIPEGAGEKQGVYNCDRGHSLGNRGSAGPYLKLGIYRGGKKRTW